jgi:hypothetical protein
MNGTSAGYLVQISIDERKEPESSGSLVDQNREASQRATFRFVIISSAISASGVPAG